MLVSSSVYMGTEAKSNLICESVCVMLYLFESYHSVYLRHFVLSRFYSHRYLVFTHLFF